MARLVYSDPVRYVFLIALLSITMLVLAAPAGAVTCADTVTINPGDTIAGVVYSICDGGTLILNPGTYPENGITIPNSITIRANTSHGGNAANTIIDGMQGGSSIFTISEWIMDPGVVLDNLTLYNGTAPNGGAIYNRGRLASVTSTFFTGCSATGNGGAIFNEMRIEAITSSSFTGCSATNGGAIYENGNDASFDSISYTRFHDNTVTGNGEAIAVAMGWAPSIERNWWGTNNGADGYLDGLTNPDTWLVLGIFADPDSITTVGTSVIRANLTFTQGGSDTSAGGRLPDGIPGSWAIVTGSGTLSPGTGATLEGMNTTTFGSPGAGTTNISATVDGQIVYVSVDVSPVPTNVPTTVPVTTTATTAVYATLSEDNDDGFPSATPTVTQAGTLPPMTVTVNIGGDSKAWQGIVTGTGIRDLIVTGTVQHGPGDNMTAPPGTVYQYISLVPARYTTITDVAIHFTVPQSWLEENHIDPRSIVLYHQTANGGWEALPTTVVTTKEGTAYFSALSPGFSLFAIAGTPTVLAPPVTTATQEIVSKPALEQTPAPAAVAQAPITTETTAPPATTPQPSASSPLLNIVLVIAAIGILASGGFVARRR